MPPVLPHTEGWRRRTRHRGQSEGLMFDAVWTFESQDRK
jgi:hypothetical protein